tara:strand:- start:270 stop:686 length:417 start_codon:yes stop_codon:yes gene_type:complete
MLNYFNFETPIGRKDYFFSIVQRFLVAIFILTIYSLLDLTLANPNKIFDSNYIDFIFESYPFGILEVFLFLPLDIRRLKNIGISLNWLYPYYLLGAFLPTSTDLSSTLYSMLYNVFLLYSISFAVYLFIKKGSSKLSH